MTIAAPNVAATGSRRGQTEAQHNKAAIGKRFILIDFGSSSMGTIAVLSFFALAAAHLGVAHRSDLPAFVGDRSEAIFDLWSLQHFCAGVLLGALLLRCKFLRFETWKELAVAAALLAFAWEAAELAMEAGLFGQVVASWKGGFEHWSNRLFGDPLMVTSGALIASRFAQAWQIVLLPAVIWLLINVISPNSMYIQRLLFG